MDGGNDLINKFRFECNFLTTKIAQLQFDKKHIYARI